MAARKLVQLATKVVTSTAVPRQAPTLFYYPGLTAKPFHSTHDFPFTTKVQSYIKVVQDEYKAVRHAYRQNDYSEVDKEHVLLKGSMRWRKLSDMGHPNEIMRKLCPKTAELLDSIPEVAAGTCFGSSYFSSFGPNSSVRPHTAASNIKLRCHLPLFVHGDAFIRVGGRFAQWEDGKLMIFDESFLHEEANVDSVKKRVVLVFDIWHPDLTEEERNILKAGYEQVKGAAK